jgi:hypothetical protein
MGRIVFCRSGDAPSLEELFDWARTDGIALSVDLPPQHDQPRWDPPFWGSVLLRYRPDRLPIPFALEMAGDYVPGAEANETLGWFSGRARSLPWSEQRGPILEHLRQTQMIASADTPYPPVGPDAVEAIRSIAEFFVQTRQGIAHVDGIGFYVGDELTLDTRTPREKRESS